MAFRKISVSFAGASVGAACPEGFGLSSTRAPVVAVAAGPMFSAVQLSKRAAATSNSELFVGRMSQGGLSRKVPEAACCRIDPGNATGQPLESVARIWSGLPGFSVPRTLIWGT